MKGDVSAPVCIDNTNAAGLQLFGRREKVLGPAADALGENGRMLKEDESLAVCAGGDGRRPLVLPSPGRPIINEARAVEVDWAGGHQRHSPTERAIPTVAKPDP